MRYSQLLGRSLRQPPKEAVNISGRLLTQGGFVDQLVSGVYSLLPLGLKVHQRIEEIIREEMVALGAQEVLLPTLQPRSLWERSGRWSTIDPPLFIVPDRHHKELGLGPTHEEVITDLATRFISSYRDLPLAVFQVQNKFRNEMRSTGGLLRVREFIMKDLYSFHASEADLDAYYQRVQEAYFNIFHRCGLEVKLAAASGGTIGGRTTHEFLCLADTGEDQVVFCPKGCWAGNYEVSSDVDTCPFCGKKVELASCIEVGHIFKIGTKYSQSFGAKYLDAGGQAQLLWMGCYGIGVGRLLATIVEAHHDKLGICWPASVAPMDVHLVTLGPDADSQVLEVGEQLYRESQAAKASVLYDDRLEVSSGVKLKDADLIGIPWRVLVSKRSLAMGGVEVSRRDNPEGEVIPSSKLAKLWQGDYSIR